MSAPSGMPIAGEREPFSGLTPRQLLRFIAEHARPFAERALRTEDRETARVLAHFADVAERHVARPGRLVLVGTVDSRD